MSLRLSRALALLHFIPPSHSGTPIFKISQKQKLIVNPTFDCRFVTKVVSCQCISSNYCVIDHTAVGRLTEISNERIYIIIFSVTIKLAHTAESKNFGAKSVLFDFS